LTGSGYRRKQQRVKKGGGRDKTCQGPAGMSTGVELKYEGGREGLSPLCVGFQRRNRRHYWGFNLSKPNEKILTFVRGRFGLRGLVM